MAKSSILLRLCVAFLSAIIVYTPGYATKSGKGVNTFANPDFAFPKTVIANAETALAQAGKSGDDVALIKAALQLTIAENDVSTSSLPSTIERLHNCAASRKGAPAAILYMIEARLMQQVYSADAYTYRRRNLPLDSFPADPTLWSADHFALRVHSLVESAIAQIPAGEPFEPWSSLFTDINEVSAPCFPTLLSAMAPIGCNILASFTSGDRALPFAPHDAPSPSEKCLRLKDSLAGLNADAALDAKDGAWAAMALPPSLTTLSPVKRYARLIEAFHTFSSSPYSGEFLVNAAHCGYALTDSTRTQLSAALDSVIARSPDYPRLDAYRQTRDGLFPASATITVNSQIAAGLPFSATVVRRNNHEPLHLLIIKMPDSKKYRSITTYLSSGKAPITASYPVEGDSAVIACQPLKPGTYTAVLSSTPTTSGVKLNGAPQEFTVSGMSLYYSCSSNDNTDARLYVVSAADGAPLKGVEVTFTADRYSRNPLVRKATTDADGCVNIPTDTRNHHWEAVARKGTDTQTLSVYSYTSSTSSELLSARIFTSLSIYKPGGECQFALFAVRTSADGNSIAPSLPVKLELINASGESVDTLALVTGLDGRASGRFTIPDDGMLGSYAIRATHNDKYLGDTYFNVEEYRRPNFFVTIDSSKHYYSMGDEILLSGKVTSYSGMPLAGASVKITLDYVPLWWRRYSHVNASYSATVTSDASGAFSLSLPSGSLRDTPFENGNFRVTCSATAPSGETQESDPATFALGNVAHITSLVPEYLKASGKELSLNCKAEGVDPHTPIAFTLCDAEGKIVAEGKAADCTAHIPATLPSGKYKVTFFFPELPDISTTSTFIIFRDSDKRPPVEATLWLPETTIDATPGTKEVTIHVGSSHSPQHLYMTVASNSRIIERRHICLDNSIDRITLPAPAVDKQLKVQFFAVHDAETSTTSLIVNGPERRLDMKVTSFRDHINAGGYERWSFRYTGINTSAAGIPVIATLSDKSLNAIVPFAWHWNLAQHYYPGISFNYISSSQLSYSVNLSPRKNYNYHSLSTPHLFTYSRSLFPTSLSVPRTLYATAAPAAGRANLSGEAVEEEAIMIADAADTAELQMNSAKMAKAESAADTAEMAVEGGGGTAEDSSAHFRPAEMPLAWFRPALVTDSLGNLEIAFDVPDFNTTWQLQLLAVNSEAIGITDILSTVASKPVMVQSSAPRFLRTGDRAMLPVTIFNNTGSSASVSGEICIFNPLTGDTIISRSFAPEQLDSMANRVMAVEFTVPSDVEFVGFRATASSGSFSDGEQSLIAILPSSSPVTESYPFYLAPGQADFSMRLPELNADSQATLQYCDNPVWYCVTALPSLSLDNDAGTISLINSIYGNALALNLVKKYPAISQAIAIWKAEGDSTLVSALERNPELKIVALASTPWANNASAESLRLQQLSDLLNPIASQAKLNESMAELLKRVNADGGWSWCPGMQSSPFITGAVLQRLAMLRSAGFDIPGPTALRALRYLDDELCESYQRSKALSTSTLLDWLYLHTFFPEADLTSCASKLQKMAIKQVRNDWEQMDISEAATAAIALHRSGYSMQAREILESLRQRATSSPTKGMWYDNLRSGFFGRGTLLTTARVLEAFAELQPASACIDPLRQWLLLQRQAQDWGTSSTMAEVVWAILSSGVTWTDSSAPAVVTLNGHELTISHTDALTGAFTIPLDRNTASGATLAIKRSASAPAWGGLIAQYVAPITTVRDFSQSDVTVTKRLLLVEQDSTGTHTREISGSIPAGARVRVTLTVTSTRDIDYAVITDEQAGCLAPVDRTSGYRFSETPLYREVRNGVTNLFIPRLPKGKFIIDYDCFAEGDGTYALGIATIQSLYAPTISAHSAGAQVTVMKK